MNGAVKCQECKKKKPQTLYGGSAWPFNPGPEFLSFQDVPRRCPFLLSSPTPSASCAFGPADMGKKGKGKAPAFLETPEALAPFSVQVRDIIATPLGVEATVVGVGSKDGALYLCWPGGIISPASPAPAKAKNKSELEAFGYARRPQSAHIQRDITERWRTQYEQRRYGKPGPKTAAIKLPLGPNGSAGSAAFAAFAASEAAKRPQTAP